MKRTAAALVFGIAMLGAAACAAADAPGDLTDMAALRRAVGADKRALVEQTLALTQAEARKFWPAYNAYQRTLESTDRRRTVVLEGLIAREREVSDRYAKALSVEMMAADEAEMRARRTMQNRVMRALPARKAARYLQLEAKLRALQLYDIAVMFPLIK
jgi:hypothetical protein